MEKAKAYTEDDIQKMIAVAIAKHDADKEEAEIEAEKAHLAAITEEQKKLNDRNNEMVTIKLFKDSGKYKDDVCVAVNGKLWQIQRGVEVQVPRFVSNVIERSIEQDQNTAMMIEKLERDYEARPQI